MAQVQSLVRGTKIPQAVQHAHPKSSLKMISEFLLCTQCIRFWTHEITFKMLYIITYICYWISILDQQWSLLGMFILTVKLITHKLLLQFFVFLCFGFLWIIVVVILNIFVRDPPFQSPFFLIRFTFEWLNAPQLTPYKLTKGQITKSCQVQELDFQRVLQCCLKMTL